MAGTLYGEGCFTSRVGGKDDQHLFVLRDQEAPEQAPPHDKIDHFIVLYMENRPFDHVFGASGATARRVLPHRALVRLN